VISARPETSTARQLVDHYLQTHANGTIEIEFRNLRIAEWK